MGKPYARELAALDDTYRQALSEDSTAVAEAIAALADLPVLAVGSGGSLSTAHFAALVHEAFTGQIAKATTPMEIGSPDPVVARSAVMFFSAGGKNRDILSAFDRAWGADARRVFVLCGRRDSPLYRRSQGKAETSVALFHIPGGKDGFLATNSLLASCVRLLKGYQLAFGTSDALPETLDALMDPADGPDWQRELNSTVQTLWDREYLLALHGPPTRPGSADLESRFHEAALGAVQVADYRNFAHGRHHWLAKRGRDTAVLALVTPRDARLAETTLSLIPTDVPVALLRTTRDGPEAALVSVVWSMFTAAAVGAARGIDPGRPGVPSFGRRIYNLSSGRQRPTNVGGADPANVAAVLRKLGVGRLATNGTRTGRDMYIACERFRVRLREAAIGGLVTDYDGTLCSRSERSRQLRRAVASELVRLSRAGVALGFATGRGGSVRDELRRSLPKSLWGRVVVGYYNGSDISTLDNNESPDRSDACASESLATVAAAVRADDRFADNCEITSRRHQITLEPRAHAVSALWAEVNDLIVRLDLQDIRVLRSGHSVDVVSAATSKRRVVHAVASRMKGEGLAVLCIGDRGRWPGNDYELLAHPYSLSVDEVSTDPSTCWNLAPPGVRGVEAALIYLKALKGRQGRARFRPREVVGHAT
jgi:hypothetical protein